MIYLPVEPSLFFVDHHSHFELIGPLEKEKLKKSDIAWSAHYMLTSYLYHANLCPKLTVLHADLKNKIVQSVYNYWLNKWS